MLPSRCCFGCFDTGSNRRIILKGKTLKIPRNVSLTDYFTRAVVTRQIQGSKAAIIHEAPTKYTFDSLDDMSSRLARAIKNELEDWTCNNEDGDIVIAFCLGTTDKMVLSIFAILKLGGTYLPIDPLCPEEKLVHIVNTTKPLMIITDPSPPIVSRFSSVANLTDVVTINTLFDSALQLRPDLNNVVPLESSKKSYERTAAIYYTSGTDSGVRIGHLAVLNRIMWQYDEIPYAENDIACLMCPTMIHTSLPDIFAPLLHGVTLVILNRATLPRPNYIISSLYEKDITRITVSSEILSSIMSTIEEKVIKSASKLIQAQLSHVSVWFCCGDSLTTELCERFFYLFHPTRPGRTGSNEKYETSPAPAQSPAHISRLASSNILINSQQTPVVPKTQKKLPILVHIYGSTETTADCTFEIFRNKQDLMLKLDGRRRVPIGIPMSNTQIFLMSPPNGTKILGKGEVGEICVSGLGLAFGYTVDVSATNFYKNPVASKDYATMFRTGDLGQITESKDEEDRLYFDGRCDSIIKLRGKRIDLNDVGRTIRATGLVNEVELFVYHQNFDDQVIVASTVLKPGVKANLVLKAIQDKIPKNAIPEIFPIFSIPLLPDGRLDRNKLTQNYKTARKSLTTDDWTALQVPPETLEQAKVLCTEVAASLGVSLKFVVTNFQDSYFNLGGNSHNVVVLIQRLMTKNFHLSLDDFVSSEKLPDVLEKMLHTNHQCDYLLMPCRLAHSLFKIAPMTEEHRDQVFKIICTCYPEKSDLALHISAEYQDFEEFLDDIWEDTVKQNLSFVVIAKGSNEVIGANLTIDGNSDMIKVKKIDKPIRYMFELMEFCEKNSKIRLTLNKGRLIQPLMIATSDTISAAHNVLIIQLLLKETIEKGRSAGFTDLFLISSLPLFRQLCKHIFKCDVLYEYPVYQFVASDKSKPFYHAGINYECSVYSKQL